MYKIENIDHYGRGITKINGKIGFIENALPNEIVEIKIYKEKKNFIEGSVLKYIEKSKDRTCVKCPYYNCCGGCDIMHLSYDKQLKFKQNKLENIINKYLKENIKINNIVKSDKIEFYRNKVVFQVKENIGFYKNNTYDIINVDKCLISNELINKAFIELKKLNLKEIKKITCRTASNELMIILETNNKNLDVSSIKKIAHSIYLKIKNEYIHVFGNKYIYEKLGNYKYMISPESFFQINIDVCLKLYTKIKEYVGHNKNILDLYCGTGSIGIFVNETNNITGIEINECAIKDANKNKELNNLNNVNFICGDSGKKLKDLNLNPAVVIVDPPRSGLNKETINNVIDLNANEIIYVSCDPMTLVRDLNILNQYYTIQEITPFDMFPNTHHIECLTYLKKRK